MKFSPIAWCNANVDKVVHASVSFSMMLLFSLIFLDFTFGYLISFLITMGIGVLKEVYDMRPGGSGWSNGDLLADLVGTVSAFIAVFSLFGFN